MSVYVYALIDPVDGRIRYVGKSSEPRERLTTHIREARRGGPLHSRRWIASVLKNQKTPELMLLAICESNDEANVEERWWIAKLTAQGADLTNRTPGGDGQPKGYKPTPEAIEAARAKLRGQHRTDEQRERLRQAFSTPEARADRRERVTRLKADNQDWLARVRKGRTGMPNSPETIAKMRASWTPERRAAQSARLKGKPASESHRAQLAAALRARWDKSGEGRT